VNTIGVPGWTQLESMPTNVSGKYVKDGGALTAATEGKTMALFAFRGNKSKEFKKYTMGNPGIWTDMETIPFGFKYKPGPPPVVDSVKYNKKFPGKGAALCFDGDHTIYATKGNGTFELWKYDLTDGHWYFESWIPSTKGAKGGTSLFFKDGLLYVLLGGQKIGNNNFFIYNPETKYWTTLPSAPTTPDNKPYKDGSCIVALGDNIYVLKGGGKHNYFSAFDGTTWHEKETIPLNHPMMGNKKTKVKDGGAMTTDGSVIYAIKGGGSHEFWQYSSSEKGIWSAIETIPRLPPLQKKSVPKTGAALAYANGRVYLLKGNKTPEFWQYGPHKALTTAEIKPPTNSAVMTENSITNLNFNFSVNPNPFNKFTTIRYTVPVSGKVTIKLYNSTGRLIETLTDEYLTAGTYTTRLTAKSLASGIYFLKYEDAKNSSEVKLIVQ
ncbi:MAG: T9SS type A sorting domain-containing protein, partial [candidate division WOR-3 bacterium]